MILIIGGMGQGKLDYVLKKTGLNKDDVATSLFQGWKKPVLNLSLIHIWTYTCTFTAAYR